MNKPTKTKLLLLFIPISLVTLLSPTIPIFSSLKTSPKNQTHRLLLHTNLQLQTAQSHCHGTRYLDLCISTISLLTDLHGRSVPEILCHFLNVTKSEVRTSESEISCLEGWKPKSMSPIESGALDDCKELLDNTMDELNAAYDGLTSSNGSPARFFTDIQTVLSAAMTNQCTCLDGFAVGSASNRTVRKYIQRGIVTISRHVSNTLAILKKIHRHAHPHADFHAANGLGLVGFGFEPGLLKKFQGFPRWLSRQDRRLLTTAGGANAKVKADVVVAKDGTGNFKTVGEAVAAAPEMSKKRFVIYIKSGAYFEYVEVNKKKINIMFLGDGIGKTWIKGNRSVFDGYTTFHSATVAVVGKGFIAKGISIENYAGPTKHQAVALRSGSDFSAFYQCSFIGYQDTLYTHSLRQFYRECDIYGTVDFIFGNAAVVLQNCNLYARLPLEEQKNMYTAQGRDDPNQNTGISILNSKVAPASDLAANKSNFRTFLGRPWKEYSRTVVMLSFIDDHVDPLGWFEWSGDFALRTLYYGEYMNRGPGSDTSERVTWPGYVVISNSKEATKFAVGNFIEGGEWLPYYGIPYYLNLTNNLLPN